MKSLRLLWLLSLLGAGVQGQSLVQVAALTCGEKVDPVGIAAGDVRFSWQLQAAGNGQFQQAYEIAVASSQANLLAGRYDSWNPGKVTSRQSILVSYHGTALLPAKTYYWRVKVWDRRGQPSAWSRPGIFVTALQRPEDWAGAKWIGYEELPDSMRLSPGLHVGDTAGLGNRCQQRPVVPLFRKEFTLSKKVRSAWVFITGLGQYEISLNGKKVGDRFLAPGWTDYDKRCLYNTYDITSLLKSGNNALGVIVGNGFYNIDRERYYKLLIASGMPKMIAQVRITYDDGSTFLLVSGSDWKTAASPITFTSIYGGEDYDARLEQTGWNAPGFNDAAWRPALLVKPPGGQLEPESDYPVRVNESLSVRHITQPSPGIWLYDFGQNASGIIELKIKGRKGQTITLTPAELLTDKGLANQEASGAPYTYSYTMRDAQPVTWRPRFSYYGFRYVQVEGAAPSEILSLRLLHTANSAPAAGSFSCSYPLFNRIDTLIRWAIKSNLQSVVTDCPHREKLGWLEQDYLMGGSIHYNYDIYHLYRQIVMDMIDAQTPTGLVPDIAPEYVPFQGGFRDSPEWGSAAVILPWMIYKWYGDAQMLRTAYPMMKKYLDYLQKTAVDNILSDGGLGDWFDMGPGELGAAQLTPKKLTATAIYYYDLDILAKTARILDDTAQAFLVEQERTAVKNAFTQKFFNSSTGVYATGSQTSMAMPLSVGLVDEERKASILSHLVDSIRASGYKLTAGDIGFHFLVQALSAGGAAKVLYDMNARDDVPGYGYQLKKGATALTESWPALRDVSNNHLMLGHIMEWFYDGLAGIGQEENSVAYDHILIKPQPVGDVTAARGTYRSSYGTISTAWKKEKNTFSLDVAIPVNTTAVIHLPATDHAQLFEMGRPLSENKDCNLESRTDEKAIVRIGSGHYRFTVKENATAQDRDPVDYVNPYIGTDKSSHFTVWESQGATFPGVLRPFGMVQIAPDRYTYTDKVIRSFSLLNHNSGWSSGGSFQLMASTGRLDPPFLPRPSSFRHAAEKTTPYYYSVRLDEDSIQAEFTAAERTAYARFTFSPFFFGAYFSATTRRNNPAGFHDHYRHWRRALFYSKVQHPIPFLFRIRWICHTTRSVPVARFHRAEFRHGYSTGRGSKVGLFPDLSCPCRRQRSSRNTRLGFCTGMPGQPENMERPPWTDRDQGRHTQPKRSFLYGPLS